MTAETDETTEIEEITRIVENFNSKWDGKTRFTHLTLLLALDSEPIALLAGPPIPKAESDARKLQ